MMNFAERMRKAAKGLRKFTARDLADEMGVQTYAERRKVKNYIQDFLRRDEFIVHQEVGGGHAEEPPVGDAGIRLGTASAHHGIRLAGGKELLHPCGRAL